MLKQTLPPTEPPVLLVPGEIVYKVVLGDIEQFVVTPETWLCGRVNRGYRLKKENCWDVTWNTQINKVVFTIPEPAMQVTNSNSAKIGTSEIKVTALSTPLDASFLFYGKEAQKTIPIENRRNVMEYVKINMGEIPLRDYYEIVAIQNGFSSYEEMKKEGFSIEKPKTFTK